MENAKEKYVIYCTNQDDNYYMDYRGEPMPFRCATIFSNEYEAHDFLRKQNITDAVYYWRVLKVSDLKEEEKSIERKKQL